MSYYTDKELNWLETCDPILRLLAKKNCPEINQPYWFPTVDWISTSNGCQITKSFCRICEQYFTFNFDEEHNKFVIEHGTMHLKERNLLPFI